MPSPTRRLLATLGVIVLTLLSFEGVVSIVYARSLLRHLPFVADLFPAGDPLAWQPIKDDERSLAAASNPGIYRLHPDPLVGYALRTNAELTLLEGTIHSDALGLRRRPAGDEPADALRIAVVGASIPFGHGLDDDQVIAHQLEQILAEVRGPTARPVICRTVAMGRWSACNSVQFLLDHFTELRPDIVVYLPYSNDLSDTDLVDETGQRRSVPDAAARDPWLPVGNGSILRMRERLRSAVDRGVIHVDAEEAGVEALIADLSPESSLRFDRNAGCLAALSERMEQEGGRMLLCTYVDSDHDWHLVSRVQAARPGFETVPLFSKVEEEFTLLGSDWHPNAQTTRTLATWIAQALLERGWVDQGAGQPLPPVPRAYELRHAPARTAEEIAALSAEARARSLAALLPEVDLGNGHGVLQIFAGLDEIGVVGTRMLVLLAAGGNTLVVRLAPIHERPDLYPLAVAVEVDGQRLGEVTVTAEGPVEAALPLPARPDPRAPLEVKLIAPRWVVQTRLGESSVAAFRPLRIACETR